LPPGLLTLPLPPFVAGAAGRCEAACAGGFGPALVLGLLAILFMTSLREPLAVFVFAGRGGGAPLPPDVAGFAAGASEAWPAWVAFEGPVIRVMRDLLRL
jgi:hypothetical protein